MPPEHISYLGQGCNKIAFEVKNLHTRLFNDNKNDF